MHIFPPCSGGDNARSDACTPPSTYLLPPGLGPHPIRSIRIDAPRPIAQLYEVFGAQRYVRTSQNVLYAVDWAVEGVDAFAQTHTLLQIEDRE